MAIKVAATASALAGLYLLLAGDISAVEIAACVICAAAGTALSVALSRTASVSFAGWPAPRAILRPIAGLVPQTFAVGRQLVAALVRYKEQRGAYVRQIFDPGGADAASAGRRAAVVLGVSLAPGSFVIRGERTDTLILHALPPEPPSPDARWLA